MKINRKCIIDNPATKNDPSVVFYLNDIRCFIDFSPVCPRVHVGTELACYSLMDDVSDKELERFILALINADHGSLKVDMDNPNIKKFLKVTNCI